MAAKTVNPQAMVSNWQKGMQSAGPAYAAGIKACTVNPMALAAEKVNDGTWAANTLAAAPRMAAALQAADPNFWKSQASGAGAQSFAQGAAKGLPKYTKKSQQLAAAATAASAAAAGVTGTMAKIQASINAMKAAFGKPLI